MRFEVISVATLGFSRHSGAFPFHPQGGGWISRRPVRNIPSPSGNPRVFTPTELELGGLPLPARVARFCFHLTSSLSLSLKRTLFLSFSLILFATPLPRPLLSFHNSFLLYAIHEMVERMDRNGTGVCEPKEMNILFMVYI